MKYCIDTDILRNRGVYPEEFLVMLLTRHCNDIFGLIEKMKANGALIENPNYKKQLMIPSGLESFVDDTLDQCGIKVKKDRWIEELAQSMIDLFPKGLKPGTHLSWRGNKVDISSRLRKFFKRYEEYNIKDVLDATKRYVDSFNGNYAYMRVLKYFIWKDEVKINEDGIGYVDSSSDLANFIENKDSNNSLAQNSFGELK